MRRYAPDAAATTMILVGLTAMMAISTDLYLPSLPAIARDLRIDVAAAQLTLSVFMCGVALGQLAIGPISDRIGRRPVLVAGTALYAIASIACALAASIDQLVAARFIQAFGACAGVVVGRAYVRDVHGREGTARVLALIGSAMSILPAIGPILGGFLVVHAGWRWNFVLLALFGGSLCALVTLRLAETNTRRNPDPTSPGRLLANYVTIGRSRGFLGFALTAALAYCGFFAFISASSFVFVDVLGESPIVYSLYFALAVFGYFLGAQATARFTLRLGLERMLAIGTLLLAGGGAAVLAVAASGLATRESWGSPPLGITMAVYCIGFGIVIPAGQAGAIGPHAQMAGAASALVGFLQTALAALVGVIVARAHDGTARPMAAAVALMGFAALLTYRVLVPRQLPRSG